MSRIVTTHVYPPIPVRTSDWCAHLDGQEEDGPYGWGRTRDEAVADLEERLAEMAVGYLHEITARCDTSALEYWIKEIGGSNG